METHGVTLSELLNRQLDAANKPYPSFCMGKADSNFTTRKTSSS